METRGPMPGVNNDRTSIAELKISVYKDMIKIAPLYLLYFTLATVILVQTFGRINYGPNLPYLISLAAIGIPFLICFVHLMSRAEHFRTKFSEEGGNTRKSSGFIISLILLIPFVFLKYTLLLFEILGRHN